MRQASRQDKLQSLAGKIGESIELSRVWRNFSTK
jgi:hypothetical protein